MLTNDKGEFRIVTLKGTQFVMHTVAPGYHAWFGTPTSGDVLKIVLERKPAPADGNDGGHAGPAGPVTPHSRLQSADTAELTEALLKDPGYTEYRHDLEESRLTYADMVATLGPTSARSIAMKASDRGHGAKVVGYERGRQVQVARVEARQHCRRHGRFSPRRCTG